MLISRRVLATGFIAVALAFNVLPATAHDVEQGPNGGPMVEVKGHHLELLAKNDTLVVFISDASHAAIASKGATGRAVILEGSAQRTLALTPTEPDQLTAKLDRPLASGARVVVSTKLGSGQDLLARFVIK